MGEGCLFLKQMLRSIGPDLQDKTVTMYKDNRGAIYLANSLVGSVRHIDVHHHSIRGVVKRGEVIIEYVQSGFHHVGVLTIGTPSKWSRRRRRYSMELRLGYWRLSFEIEKSMGLSDHATNLWCSLPERGVVLESISCYCPQYAIGRYTSFLVAPCL